MKTPVAQWGNSAALRLPKLVLEELRIAPGSEVEMSIEGRELRIRPIPSVANYRLEDLLAQIKPGQVPPFEDWSAAEMPWPDDDWSDIAPRGNEWPTMKRRAERKRATRKRRA